MSRLPPAPYAPPHLRLERVGPDAWLFLEYLDFPWGRQRWVIRRYPPEATRPPGWEGLDAMYMMVSPTDGATHERALGLLPIEAELAAEAITLIRAREVAASRAREN